MTAPYGDPLSRAVDARIGRFFAAEADLEDISTQDRDEGRLFVAAAERTLWIWDPDSSAGASSYVVVPTDSPTTGRLVRIDAALATSLAGISADGTFTMSSPVVGKAVYGDSADHVALADADNATKIPAVGVVAEVLSGTSALVRFCGIVPAAGTFTAWAIQYLSTTAGALTETPPATPNATPVGIAVNTTDLLVLPLGVLSYILRSTTANLGADTIGFVDTNSNTSNGTVGAVLDEILVDLKTAKLVVEVDLFNGILADGTPLAKWADNAGASAPGTTLADSKAAGVRWNNQGTQTAVWAKPIVIPYEADISANATLRILCSKSGNTLADETTFTVTAFANTVGLAHDADSDFGGTSSAITGDATAKTIQASTLTLTAANLAAAAAPATISMSIKPSDGTLGTDDIVVEAVFIEFKRKLRTS